MKNSFTVTVIAAVIACIVSFASNCQCVPFSEPDSAVNYRNSAFSIGNVSFANDPDCDDSGSDGALLVSTRSADRYCFRTLKQTRAGGAASGRIGFVTAGTVVKNCRLSCSWKLVRNCVARDYINFRNLRI